MGAIVHEIYIYVEPLAKLSFRSLCLPAQTLHYA
jgi:hypothetical protein